ncbi:MAG: DUF3300 domain-containing protein [Woeseia sp.]
MKNKLPHWISPRLLVLLTLLSTALAVLAQTPVDADGKPLGPVYTDSGDNDGVAVDPLGIPDDVAAADDEMTAANEIALLSDSDLEALIGPVALYPDDLLAVVLPASTYPLQIVQAARYLEQRESDASLQPDDAWDDSVVALLNYPEVLTMMSEDIDWTWRLGEAVVAQQGAVVAAVERFRDRAYAAGNLKTDQRQTVSRNDDDVIEIAPVEDDVIYVPYYEPERVVVYQSEPVYHYYPRAYPVYYYPYPAGYHFYNDYFWGVTTAFRIGWYSDHLHVYHHSYRGHPYFGWNYYGNYWRNPSVQIFNSWYGGNSYATNYDRYRYGNYWRPRRLGGARPGVHPGRDRYYSNRRRSSSEDGYADRDRDRRDHRQNGGQQGRAAVGNSTTPRIASRNGTNRGNPNAATPRERNDLRTESRRRAASEAGSRDTANTRRQPAPAQRSRDNAESPRTSTAAPGAAARTADARRSLSRDEPRNAIRFRDRNPEQAATAETRRAPAQNSNAVANRTARQAGSNTAPNTRAARREPQDPRDRMQRNMGEPQRATGQTATSRRSTEPRSANARSAARQAPVAQAPAASGRAIPQQRSAPRSATRTPDAATAPVRVAPSANREARRSGVAEQRTVTRNAAPVQQRQVRQSAPPARAASAPQPARAAAPNPRSADRSAPAAKASRSGNSRARDARRQRD